MFRTSGKRIGARTGAALAAALLAGSLVSVASPAQAAAPATGIVKQALAPNLSVWSVAASEIRSQAYKLTATGATTAQRRAAADKILGAMGQVSMTGTSGTEWARNILLFRESVAQGYWNSAKWRATTTADKLSAIISAYQRGDSAATQFRAP